MMMLLAGFIGGAGLVCMISRQTLMGLLIGLQLLILGSTMMFISAGIASGLPNEGYIFGLFITLGGIIQLVVGYSLTIRLFFLKKKISMDQIQALKR